MVSPRFWSCRLVILLVLCLASGRVLASAAARQVVSGSALGTRIQLLPLLVHQELVRPLARSHQMDPRMGNALDLLLYDDYDAAAVEAELVRQLDAHVGSDQLRRVGNWYASPLGHKVVDAERSAMQDQIEGLEPASLRALEHRYRGTARENLFNEYDRTWRGAEFLVETAQRAQLLLVDALGRLHSDGDSRLQEVLRAQIRKRRFIAGGVLEEDLYLRYLYTYRGLSDGQLQAYVAFLQTDAARRCDAVVARSLRNAILVPVGELVDRLGELRELSPPRP